jgi:MYXO-CTERM domain-containing protein
MNRSADSLPRAATLGVLGMAIAAGCRPGSVGDPADLTDVARRMETLVETTPNKPITLSDILGKGPRPAGLDFDVPETIRIWRRSEGAATSCDGPVDILDFETYVARVLAHEWYMSWEHDSHKAGAIAIRSYAAWWVNAGGKYDCADVCDTTYTQAYGDESHPNADSAVEATTGQFAVEDGSVVFAEYSAENSDPTEYGVSEPHCTGLDVYGHGRGMCQWGTQRWSLNDGSSPEWMVEHYYPGATVTGTFAGTLDTFFDDIEMQSNETLAIEVSFENTGGTPWNSGEVLLRAIDPELRSSPFYDPDTWTNPEQVGALYEDVEVGDIGTFEFQIRAPEVASETEYFETFAIYSTDANDWGALDEPLELPIVVRPANGDDPDDPPPDDDDDDDSIDGGSDTGDSLSEQRSPRSTTSKTDPGDEKGCGCSTVESGDTRGPMLLLLALLGAVGTRRYPRPRSPACRPLHSRSD